MPPRLVLVTDGGDGRGRSALAATRALGAAGYRAAVTVSGRGSVAAASRHCAATVRVPRVVEPGYAAAVWAEVQEHEYLAVLPCSDAALLALGAPVEHLVDKRRLADAAAHAGIETPESVTFASPAAAGEHIGIRFPVVVKPVVSVRPAARADDEAQLRAVLQDVEGEVIVQRFVDEPMRAVAGVVWEGRLRAVCHQRYVRTWPRDCGTASAAETTAPDHDLEERLVSMLGTYEGIFQAQFAGSVLLDLNPRPYGSLPLAVAAGTNLVGLWCAHIEGVLPPDGPVMRARPGVRYRWIEGDLRHLTARVASREIGMSELVRALRPRLRTAHSTESLTDPRPSLERVRSVLRRG